MKSFENLMKAKDPIEAALGTTRAKTPGRGHCLLRDPPLARAFSSPLRLTEEIFELLSRGAADPLHPPCPEIHNFLIGKPGISWQGGARGGGRQPPLLRSSNISSVNRNPMKSL